MSHDPGHSQTFHIDPVPETLDISHYQYTNTGGSETAGETVLLFNAALPKRLTITTPPARTNLDPQYEAGRSDIVLHNYGATIELVLPYRRDFWGTFEFAGEYDGPPSEDRRNILLRKHDNMRILWHEKQPGKLHIKNRLIRRVAKELDAGIVFKHCDLQPRIPFAAAGKAEFLEGHISFIAEWRDTAAVVLRANGEVLDKWTSVKAGAQCLFYKLGPVQLAKLRRGLTMSTIRQIELVVIRGSNRRVVWTAPVVVDMPVVPTGN